MGTLLKQACENIPVLPGELLLRNSQPHVVTFLTLRHMYILTGYHLVLHEHRGVSD